VISDVRFAGKRDRNHLLRLVVVERLKNELVEIVDINGSAAGFAGAVNGMFGQGSPGEQWQAGTPRCANASGRSAVPMGVLRANGGCGGRIGRQAKENDRGALHSVHCLPGSKDGRTF